MHDIKLIRDDPAAFRAGLIARNVDPGTAAALAARLLGLDDERRAAIAESQAVQERRNAASREIGAAMKAGDAARACELTAVVAGLKLDAPRLETRERDAVAALEAALAAVPNTPLPGVLAGADEDANVEVRRHGAPPAFPEGFVPREHFDIGEALDGMDFETAARTSGARFVYLKGRLARLERALQQFMLDLHVDRHGYVEIAPPLLVRDRAMFGTAQLPKFEDDQFAAMNLPEVKALRDALAGAGRRPPEDFPLDHLWLIPTAEVPLTNIARERVLAEADLPLRFVAGTPCFRAEAGAAGRDARGLIRQHQFNKVELVTITTPEAAEAEHERMTACAEEVLKQLGLPYRVVLLCGGDMGFSARKTYDIEVWLPGQNRFREISSCSVCGDFQARRMDARFRPTGGKGTRHVATLNGSGVAVGRALVAVLENHQNPDGSVTVPEVLRPYMGGAAAIGP
jgi:seryl-tRNA synthetase